MTWVCIQHGFLHYCHVSITLQLLKTSALRSYRYSLLTESTEESLEITLCLKTNPRFPGLCPVVIIKLIFSLKCIFLMLENRQHCFVRELHRSATQHDFMANVLSCICKHILGKTQLTGNILNVSMYLQTTIKHNYRGLCFIFNKHS